MSIYIKVYIILYYRISFFITYNLYHFIYKTYIQIICFNIREKEKRFFSIFISASDANAILYLNNNDNKDISYYSCKFANLEFQTELLQYFCSEDT